MRERSHLSGSNEATLGQIGDARIVASGSLFVGGESGSVVAVRTRPSIRRGIEAILGPNRSHYGSRSKPFRPLLPLGLSLDSTTLNGPWIGPGNACRPARLYPRPDPRAVE